MVLTCLLTSSHAAADGGSFANIKAPGTSYGAWTVDVSATSDTCVPASYGQDCGWFPVAWVVPQTQACASGGSGYVWVGASNSAGGTQSAPAQTFYPPAPPFRLCLYLYKASVYRLTAEATFDGAALTPIAVPGVLQPAPPPAPTLSPSPAPAPAQGGTPSAPRRCSEFSWQEEAQAALDSDPFVQAATLDPNGDGIACAHLEHKFSTSTTTVYRRSSLSKSQAARVVRHALWKRYGSRYTARRGYQRSCGRISRTRVRCRVSWTTSKSRYRGKVTVWTSVTDEGERYYHWSVRVKRQSLAPKPAPKPVSPSNPPTGGGGCDPNYSGCLDPNAYDYDCVGGSGDGPLYTGTVVVTGSDHYGLDADGDGIGCE